MDKLKKLSIELPKFNFELSKLSLFSSESKESKERKKSNNNLLPISSLTISEPTDFKHNISVKYDELSHKFIGLPEDWRLLLEKNNIKLKSIIF